MPAWVTMRPTTGQSATSALETKRDGTTALRATMSSQETWLETTSLAPGRACPCTTNSIPSMRSIFPDQRTHSASRPRSSSLGQTSQERT